MALDDIERRAALAAAAISADSAECRDLLEMLGLVETDPLCSRCGLSMSRPLSDGYVRAGANGVCWLCVHPIPRNAVVCSCGRIATAADGVHCGRCYRTVPAEQLHTVMDRITERLADEYGPGIGGPRIAALAGVTYGSLAAALGADRQRVTEDLYSRIAELDRRLEDGERLDIPVADARGDEVRANIQLLRDAGLTYIEIADMTGVDRHTLVRVMERRDQRGRLQRWVRARVADKIAAVLQPVGVS